MGCLIDPVELAAMIVQAFFERSEALGMETDAVFEGRAEA